MASGADFPQENSHFFDIAPEGGLDRLFEAVGEARRGRGQGHGNGVAEAFDAIPGGLPAGPAALNAASADGDRRSASAGRGLVFGALLAFAVMVWPAMRAVGLGLDRAPDPELGLGLGAAIGGFLVGVALRRRRPTVPWLGLLTAIVAISLAVASGAGAGFGVPGVPWSGLPATWLRPMAVATALLLGLALGALAPARGWLPVLASGIGALLFVVAYRLLGPHCPVHWQSAALLLAPGVALLAAGRVRGAGLLRLVPSVSAAAVAIVLVQWAADPALAPELRQAIAAGRARPLARHGEAVLIYDRRTQELQLWQRGQLVDAEGPDRPRSPFVATAVRALTSPGDRVLVLGAGLGRLPAALATAGLPGAEIVHHRLEVTPLLGRGRAIGAVDDPAGTEVSATSGIFGGRRLAGARATLAALPAGSRQVIVVGEPLHGCDAFATASVDRAGGEEPLRDHSTQSRSDRTRSPVGDWQCELAAQRELRRVAGDGLVVQPFAMDRTPPGRLAALLTAAAVAHPTNVVLAIGDCGLLLSVARPWRWPAATAFDSWPAAARWQAHAAHLGSAEDLQRAWLGTVTAERQLARPAVLLAAGGGGEAGAGDTDWPQTAASAGRRATLRVLHDCLEPAPALTAAGSSQLLWWVDLRSRLRAFERSLRQAGTDPVARERLRSAAAAFLPTGGRSAAVQAALALPDAAGTRFADPEFATLAAFAIDPTFHDTLPPLLADLPRPLRRFGDLEDLARLPAPARLAELLAETSTLAVALRVRFPSACARALVAELARGPLAAAQLEALRQLADPFVLAMAGRALAERSALPELIGLWRRDLAMPAVLALLLRGTTVERQGLAGVLAGRRDERSLAALAALMLDPELAVREAAARAVPITGRGRIEFDPKWGYGKRFVAAERVRVLHNRAP
ncbi:MAG: hypothetical protein NXI31_01890 [bacterium]|nr:hypothetical protein [bacterium]